MSTALAPSVTRHDKIVKGTSCHLRTIRDKLSGGPIVRGPVAKRFDRALISRKRVFARCCRPFNRSTRPTGTTRWHFCSAGKKIQQFEPNYQKKLSSFSWRSRQQFQGFVSRPSEQFFAQDIVFKMDPFFNFKRKNIIWHPGLEPSTFWLDFGSLWHLLSIHQHVLFAVTSNKSLQLM